MSLSIQERNRMNIISRWQKIHAAESKRICKKGNTHLLSRLCGFIAGDGNIYSGHTKGNRHFMLRFYPDNDSLIKPFSIALMKIYNKRAKVKKLKNYYFLLVDSKIVVLDLLKYADFSTLTWGIPNIVTHNKGNKREWLRAFFDCESYIGKYNIKLHSVNEKGLKEIKKMLSNFGIYSKMYEYKPKNKNWNTNYILLVARKENMKRYLKEIGFNHKVKLKKLKEYLR